MMKKILTSLVLLSLICVVLVGAETSTTSNNQIVSGTSSNQIECPQYMPPVDGWCEGGTIVPQPKDENGCSVPAKCVYQSDVSSCIVGCVCNGDTITCPSEKEPTITTTVQTGKTETDSTEEITSNGKIPILSPKHVSDKIVTHGYNLVDSYIKEHPEATSSFPGGIFSFTLINDIKISISPSFINGKVWRTIDFGNPDGTVHAIVLDGPVYKEPGTINIEAMESAKEELSNLLEKEMIVTMILKESVSLNLEDKQDFSMFIKKMYEIINVSILAEPEPASATISISKTGTGEISIQSGKVEVVTSEKVFVVNSKLLIETSTGTKEIKVMPEEVSEILGTSSIETAELKAEDEKTAYFVTGTKKAKVLMVFPTEMKVEAKVNAETGEIISMEKPWWSFLAKEE